MQHKGDIDDTFVIVGVRREPARACIEIDASVYLVVKIDTPENIFLF
ncbi:hypothetical protein [Shewanella benthica]|uniref:Uncharacterized protein n=1 Tax=Shewanella benthica KT99 TaxID=314608 RepID=A9CZ13_9GAMM|nr:hypothetical protein [Shewanella benthica]EDQ02228.1 hypothetical protein KT99_12699 [Shewanella benthica KT99]